MTRARPHARRLEMRRRTRPAAGVAPARRRADHAVLLRDRDRAVPARRRPRSGAAAHDGARHPVGGALLAAMLSLGRLFAPDHADGTLEQMLLSPEPLTLLVAGKVLAHWLVSGLPLVLLAPLLALQFDMPPGAIGVLAL